MEKVTLSMCSSSNCTYGHAGHAMIQREFPALADV